MLQICHLGWLATAVPLIKPSSRLRGRGGVRNRLMSTVHQSKSAGWLPMLHFPIALHCKAEELIPLISCRACRDLLLPQR
jgi:hypothetical protein